MADKMNDTARSILRDLVDTAGSEVVILHAQMVCLVVHFIMSAAVTNEEESCLEDFIGSIRETLKHTLGKQLQ